ncbi:MAG: hypothetical protein Q4C47_06150 [Planctomycetia bacterium]|nr:hypothetical protein [Planctomycetia bacterium]
MTPEMIVSRDSAESYFANRLYSEVWENASSTNRSKALQWATAMISGAFAFRESAYQTDAEGVVTWKPRVIYAVCEQAIWVLRQDPTTWPAALTQGLSEGTAGAVSGKFDREFILPLLSPVAVSLIGDLGTLNGGTTITSTPLGD